MDSTSRQDRMLAGAQILSVILGYENLIENREQSAHNDVEKANRDQANYILEEISKKFDEQNAMLKDILIALARMEIQASGPNLAAAIDWKKLYPSISEIIPDFAHPWKSRRKDS